MTTESELVDYIVMLESGDAKPFSNPSFLEEMRKKCIAVINDGFSSEAHYLLGIYHIQKGENEKARVERLKAAYLGHCVAAMDYASQSDDYDSVEILGIVKAMNEAGEDLDSAQEDFDYYLSCMSEDKEKAVNKVARAVVASMKEKGLSFQR
ncbi:MAG: hypothetical protein COA42_17640 [Alteromonadaceae bacterium]|nr:MAG: hypothetical protein COA42_17640 [Alteromonadaceae bacterium]